MHYWSAAVYITYCVLMYMYVSACLIIMHTQVHIVYIDVHVCIYSVPVNYNCMYTVEPLYCGHHWDPITVLISGVGVPLCVSNYAHVHVYFSYYTGWGLGCIPN